MPYGGWGGLPEVPCDGQNWPLSFAAELLEIPEEDLRSLIKLIGLKPTGTIKTTDYRRQGRNPRSYSASQLVALVQGFRDLKVQLAAELGTVTQVGFG